MLQTKRLSPGFSLLELVIAILILGILAGVGIPSYLYIVGTAKESNTKTNLKLIKSSVDFYQMKNNHYPARLNDLVERPKGDAGKGWTRSSLDKLPQDGWGQDFYYKLLPAGSKHPYELYSFGANGPEGGTPEEHLSAWD